jgi:hypothetical protein
MSATTPTVSLGSRSTGAGAADTSRLLAWSALAVAAGALIGGASAASPLVTLLSVIGIIAATVTLVDAFKAFLLFLVASTLVPQFISFQFLTVTFFSARFGMLLLAAALAVRWAIGRESFPSPRTALDRYLYALIGVMLLSLMVNASGMTAAQVLAGIRVCLYFVADYVGLFAATILVVRLTGPRAIHRILLVLIGLLTLAAAVGIAEHVTEVNSYQFISRHVPWLLGGVGEEWGEYLTTNRARGVFLRSSSTFSHFLDFGAAMAMGIPIAGHLLLYARGTIGRSLLLIALSLQAAGLVFSFSRGALLAVGLAMLSYLLLTRNRKGLAVGVGGVLLVGAFFLALPRVRSTMLEVFLPAGGYSAEGSIRDRLEDYEPMAALAKAHPVLGMGPGMLLRQGFVADHPHLASLRALDNYYLVVLGETGFLGLGVFLLLCWKIGRFVLAMPGEPAVPGEQVQSLRAAVAAAAVAFMFLSATFDAWGFSSARIFWIVVALGVASHDARPGRAAFARPRRES